MKRPDEAIILAAGVGSRLGTRAAGMPKCLVPVAGKPILQWQVTALRAVGVRRLVVVTGHEAALVQQALDAMAPDMIRQYVLNPQYARTNVLTSWREGSEHLQGAHYYLHADTVFEPFLLQRLAEKGHGAPVTLTVDQHACGEEEMKVRVEGDRLLEISKTMDAAAAFGEFTGILRAEGEILPALREQADALLASGDGSRLFFEAALEGVLARQPAAVTWVDVSDLRWREVDFPEDLDAAERMFVDSGGR